MNSSRLSLLKSSAIILCVGASAIQSNSQSVPAKHRGEQTLFSVESAFEYPVALNAAAKEALAISPALAEDLKQKDLAPKDLPDGWFTASAVHLGAKNQVGLVVMGVDGLLGANTTTHFWVLRQTSTGYELVLDTTAADLDVLTTKTSGLRDIEIAFLGGVAWGSEGLKFDGHRYQLTTRTWQTAGAKVPSDLKGYETHAPFAQPADDDTGQVLAQAREWIWEQWKAHKRFYVTASAQDDDGNQGTYQLYTSSDPNYPSLILKIHKTDWEQDSPSEPRHKITEDDLWDVPELVRIYPAIDEDHEPQVIPDEKNVAASEYRLGFCEGLHWLATL
jgi:hypothetical protein